ncbi:MAG: hypothetical protein A4E19_10735 [Nitrospira sp. SG-bin1]|nr:MAG: hypothetical protein A4E19_10735 [Nitrospira sp. SG-bin1]
MIPPALESWAFWTGVAGVVFPALGALCGGLSWWFSSTIKSLKEEIDVTEGEKIQALTETVSYLQLPAEWTLKAGVVLTALGALCGGLSWWFTSTVGDMKEGARRHFEEESKTKLEVAAQEVLRARQETAKALADVAVANERAGKLEAKAAALRDQAARVEYMMRAAEARSEEAKKEAAQAGEGTAKALAETAATKERANKLEGEAAALRERAARAEAELLKVKDRIKRRIISDAQRARLLKKLKPLPKEPIGIVALLGDEEAVSLARQIADILKEAGWDNITVKQALFSGRVRDFEIRIRDRQNIPSFAVQVGEAFDSIGFMPTAVIDRSVPDGALEIVVGMKPNSE